MSYKEIHILIFSYVQQQNYFVSIIYGTMIFGK